MFQVIILQYLPHKDCLKSLTISILCLFKLCILKLSRLLQIWTEKFSIEGIFFINIDQWLESIGIHDDMKCKDTSLNLINKKSYINSEKKNNM